MCSWQVTLGIRVMAMIGVEILILTNASGGLNQNYQAGDFMILKDHLNLPGLMGWNPLIGIQDER